MEAKETAGRGANARPLLATVTLVLALMGAIAWWSFEPPLVEPSASHCPTLDSPARMPTTRLAGKPDLHLAVIIDMTLLALALGALLGFGAGWLLRPHDTPAPVPFGSAERERANQAQHTTGPPPTSSRCAR